LDFYQDAGIWIVIASCVAEYLLLLTYIGVAAYDFFKNRKMMKKMNVQRRTYDFLKFDESHRDVGSRLHNAVSRVTESATIFKTTRKIMNQARSTPQNERPELPLSRNILETKREEIQAAPNNPQLLKFDGECAPNSNTPTKKPKLARKRFYLGQR